MFKEAWAQDEGQPWPLRWSKACAAEQNHSCGIFVPPPQQPKVPIMQSQGSPGSGAGHEGKPCPSTNSPMLICRASARSAAPSSGGVAGRSRIRCATLLAAHLCLSL